MQKRTLALATLIATPMLSHASVPGTGNPTSFLGPTIKLGVVQSLSATNAYALSGALGQNNLRFDGTLGFQFVENQRLKLSAEYLVQNISYGFASGNTAQWIQQGSIGANYRYDLGEYIFMYDPSFTIDAYFARSPNKSLRNNAGSYVNSSGITVPYTDTTRIGGATAGGISPGLYFHPWQDGMAGFDVNYDNVQYNTIYLPANSPKGFGGTFHLNQTLNEGVDLHLQAGFRQPFNNYQIHVTWFAIPFYGLWSIGADGDYTIGKNRLPSTYDLGLSINYLIDKCHSTSFAQQERTARFFDDVATPAGYLPQVFGTRDEWFR